MALIESEDPIVQVPADPNLTVDGQDVILGTDSASDAYLKTPGAQNNITIYRYPEQLAADIQYPHYVMFYINARQDTTMATKRGGRTDIHGDETGQNRIDPDHAAAVGATTLGTSFGLAAGKQGAKTLSDQLIGKAPLGLRAAANVIGGVTGAVAGGVVGGTLGAAYGKLTSRQLVKIKDVIALHINNPPSVAYQANWSESDMGFVGAIGSGRISDVKLTDMAGGGLDLLARAMASGLPKVAGGPNAKDVMEAVSRRVTNPYKEQLFKSMGMRQFAFDYTFLPKSPREARNVLNILRIFKRNMHPEMDKSKLFLVYPAEFSIVYYYRDSENDYLNKISSCVLTNLNIKFGDRDFATFRGGFPSQINVRLQFLELEMLTGERVDDDIELTGTKFGF